MTEFLLTTSVAILLGLYIWFKPKLCRVGPFLPDSFLFGIGLYALGAMIVHLTEELPNSDVLVVISLTALMSASLGGILFVFLFGRLYRDVHFVNQFSRIDSGPLERFSIKLLLLISAILCVTFVYVIFSNSIVGALLSIASLVSDSTFLDARKAITSGTDGYFAPGYVKQFRDIIIPVLLIATMGITPAFRRRPVVWFAFASAIVAMIVSGQRLVFVVFFLSLLLGYYYTSRFPDRRRISVRRESRNLWSGIAVLFIIYAALTVLLGRASDELTVAGTIADIFLNLVGRIFLAAPRENIITLPLWHMLGPTYGQSWLADLSGILPGVSESFSNILHSQTGGSLQGNSPLGLPADVWFAWGWAGILVVPFLYAVAVGILDMVLLMGRSAILFGMRIYMFVVLPICYSPFLFILYGAAVAIVMLFLVLVLRSRHYWRIHPAPTAV